MYIHKSQLYFIEHKLLSLPQNVFIKSNHLSDDKEKRC